jgi:hypothetical protein
MSISFLAYRKKVLGPSLCKPPSFSLPLSLDLRTERPFIGY